MSDALALLGIYLTIVTVLMTLSFARMESWYVRTYDAMQSWTRIKDTSDYGRKVELNRQCRSLIDEVPILSLAFVGFMLGVISTFAVYIGQSVDNPTVSRWYIYTPAGMIELVYLGSILVMLKRGSGNLDEVIEELKPHL